MTSRSLFRRLLVLSIAAAVLPVVAAPPAAPAPAANSPAIPRTLDVPNNALVAPGPPPELDLLYTGDVIGYLEDCGCHMNPAGGDTPVYTYRSAEGFGCAGCHGMNYGETVPMGLGLPGEGAKLNREVAAKDPVLRSQGGEIQIEDYSCRSSRGIVSGRGFDSPRLHQLKKAQAGLF